MSSVHNIVEPPIPQTGRASQRSQNTRRVFKSGYYPSFQLGAGARFESDTCAGVATVDLGQEKVKVEQGATRRPSGSLAHSRHSRWTHVRLAVWLLEGLSTRSGVR